MFFIKVPERMYQYIWIYGGSIGDIAEFWRIRTMGKKPSRKARLILANSHYGEETVTKNLTFKPGMRFHCPPVEIIHEKLSF